jgi:hypothetical protein
MNALGTGYFQQKFTSTCTKPTCTFGEVTKERLALRKLASDVVKKADSTDYVDPSSYLAYVSISGSGDIITHSATVAASSLPMHSMVPK